MASIEIKDQKGKAVGKAELGSIANAEPLMHLLHKAVVTEEANKRQGTQKTKSRSEVSGGGRKPYKQKKTGNARQGSTRSPQWAHGAMALPIMPRDYTKDLNKKERRAAILGAINAQVTAGKVTVVDKIQFAVSKTKDAVKLLQSLGVNDAKRVLVITSTYDETTYKSFRNLTNVTVRTAPSTSKDAKTNAFSTRDILVAHQIVVAKDALEQIESVWGSEPKKESKLKAEAKPKAEVKPKAEPKPKSEKPAAKKAAPKKKEDSK